VGPCHHGKPRPQVAGGGTASNVKASYKYIEQAVADSWQRGGPTVWGLGEVLTTPQRKTWDATKRSKLPRAWTGYFSRIECTIKS